MSSIEYSFISLEFTYIIIIVILIVIIFTLLSVLKVFEKPKVPIVLCQNKAFLETILKAAPMLQLP